MTKPKLNKKNYYDDKYYWSSSFVKSMYRCSAEALAVLNGEYEKPSSSALLIGSYVDSWFDGKKVYEQFVSEHPEIFNSRTGGLKSDYINADKMIAKAKSDKLFMSYCKGRRQAIKIGTIGGLPFKCKLDFLQDDKIVDLKTCKDFEPVYVAEQGRVNFAEAYYYPLQLAIYQELVYQNTGKRLPCFLACVTKQDPPDLDVIKIPQHMMDAEMKILLEKLPLLDAMRQGIVEPNRCEKCVYCRKTKKLTEVKSLEDYE